MGKSKAAPDLVLAAERRVKALELRKLGFTYRKIGEQLGFTEAAAHKSVTNALRELNEQGAETAAEVRRLELERLDDWLVRVAKEMQGDNALGAVDRGLRLMARRAKLLGLDAPTKVVYSEVEEQRIQDLMRAAGSGEESARLALERIAMGENAQLVCHEWGRFIRLPLVCSPNETARMTPAELALAAQGKLTQVALVAIRERAGDEIGES